MVIVARGSTAQPTAPCRQETWLIREPTRPPAIELPTIVQPTERSTAILRQAKNSAAALKCHHVSGNRAGPRNVPVSAGERYRFVVDVPEAAIAVGRGPDVTAVFNADAELERVGPIGTQAERARHELRLIRAEIERGER